MKLHRLGAALLCLVILAGCELIFTPQDEGTEDDPVQIYVGTPHYGSVSDWGTSYYSFVSGAGGTYTISLTDIGTGSDLSWHLHDSSRLSMYCWDEYDNNGDEISTFPLEVSRTYYLRVEEWDWDGTWFYLTVTGP